MNWSKCTAVFDPSYVSMRNGLIAQAEVYANLHAPFAPLPNAIELAKQEHGYTLKARMDIRWSRCYLEAMTNLARKHRLQL